jgi:hypothetical protein
VTSIAVDGSAETGELTIGHRSGRTAIAGQGDPVARLARLLLK